MTRRLILLLCLPICVLGVATTACSTLAVAAATVNGDKITESQVESDLNVVRDDPIFGEAVRRDPDQRGQRRRQILSELIRQTVAEQEARRLGIRVTQAQVDRLIEQTARAQGQTVDAFLVAENLSRAEARRLAERPVRRFALLERVVRDVGVDDDAVREVYEGQEERFVDVHLERITVADLDAAREVLQEVDGASFAEVARQRSLDDLAENGGDMGYLPLTSLEVEVQGAVNAAVERGMTDPIETADGRYEIYRLVDRQTKPFEDVSGEIRESLSQGERDERFESWLSDKVRDAKIVVNPKYGRFDADANPPSVVPSTSELRP